MDCKKKQRQERTIMIILIAGTRVDQFFLLHKTFLLGRIPFPNAKRGVSIIFQKFYMGNRMLCQKSVGVFKMPYNLIFILLVHFCSSIRIYVTLLYLGLNNINLLQKGFVFCNHSISSYRIVTGFNTTLKLSVYC